MKRITVVVLLWCATGLTVGADIPARPEQIEFAPLKFEPPKAEDYRHVLSTGVVVYTAPSAEFPLINLKLTFRAGEFLDPPDKIGLAAATGAMIRRGGAEGMSAAELDEEFDFLAAQVGTGLRGAQCGASLNCLKSNFDQCLALFMNMVRNPAFQQDRLDLYKAEVIESLKQRNDDADPILSREWNALLFGRDHFEGAQPTGQSIETISRDDLMLLHKRVFHPAAGQMYIEVTGDFVESEMLAKLDKALADWPSGERIGDPPAPTATFEPSVYHVEKDIPQGKVNIGIRAIKRDDPDYFPVLLMNEILGGGGFTSRITNRVRSDEGLAYHASSHSIPRVWYPGEWRGTFQSKNETVAFAIEIVMEEIDRIRSEPVTKRELDVAKDSFIETFPRNFESKAAMLDLFVTDEMTNRPKDFWQTYRDNIRAVTAEDIQRVAKKYLNPEQMAVMIVGRWEEIEAGDLQKRASMSQFFGGKVTHLPLRDPLTLEPMKK